MSLNCVMLSTDGCSAIPLPQEKTFFTQDKIKLVLDCSENGYPGNSGGHWTSQGLVSLSNQRIVFIAAAPDDVFQTLNVPIRHFKNWKLEQPWFGANYIEGTVIPVQGGGLLKHGKLTLVFREGGAIEFTTLLQTLLERMAETSEVPSHIEPLPTYQAEGSSTPSNPVYGSPSAQTYPPPPPPPSGPVYPPSNQTYPVFPVAMPTPSNQTYPSLLPMPAPPHQDLPPAYNDIDGR